MQNDQRFAINYAVDLQDLGKRIEDAIDYQKNKDYDATRDALLELHHQIYPNASRILTHEEAEAYYAEARKEAAAAGYETQGYRPLMLDEADVPNPQAASSIDKLHQVINQILEGEKEPAAFLEVLEMTWRITHDCSSAMDKVDAVINQNIALMQQNQHLLRVLNLISQGVNHCTPQYPN